MENIFWYDSETTGLDKKKHQIISFAVVVTDQKFNVIDQYFKFVKLNGTSEITKEAMDVNKIDLNSKEYLDNAISEAQLLYEVSHFILKHKTQKSVSMAHNGQFDDGFYEEIVLKFSAKNIFSFLHKKLCSLKYFRKLISSGLIDTKEVENKTTGQKYKSSKLEHLTEALKIDHTAHHALGDVLALIQVYKKAIKLEKNIDYFEIY